MSSGPVYGPPLTRIPAPASGVNFARLFGRQASDKDKQDLFVVRDVLKVKTTDSVWAFLMILQYYKALYEEFPPRIEASSFSAT